LKRIPLIRELSMSTNWGAQEEINWPETVLKKYNVRAFMKNYGYEGLIPRMNMWCKAYKVDKYVYIKASDLNNITWNTFMQHLTEVVEMELKTLPKD